MRDVVLGEARKAGPHDRSLIEEKTSSHTPRPSCHECAEGTRSEPSDRRRKPVPGPPEAAENRRGNPLGQLPFPHCSSQRTTAPQGRRKRLRKARGRSSCDQDDLHWSRDEPGYSSCYPPVLRPPSCQKIARAWRNSESPRAGRRSVSTGSCESAGDCSVTRSGL